jgi:hypothetical protein
MGWMRNTEGKEDAVLTMSIVGFVVVLLKVLLTDVTVGQWSFGSIDAGTVAAILTPTLGAYVARRYTDRKMKASYSYKEEVVEEQKGLDQSD